MPPSVCDSVAGLPTARKRRRARVQCRRQRAGASVLLSMRGPVKLTLMSPVQAVAEVFWTAFKALPRGVQEDFLDRLMVDRRIRRELEDRLDNETVDRALKEPGRVSWDTLKKGLKA